MIRVLYVEHDLGRIGGSFRALQRLIEHLDRSRYEPFVSFMRNTPNPIQRDFEALGCSIVPVGRYPFRWTPFPPPSRALQGGGADLRIRVALHSLGILADDLPRFLDVARAVRAHNIDLIHANNHLRANRYAIWAAALTGVPIVCHQRFHFRIRRLERWAAARVRRLLCISQSVRDHVASVAAAERLRIIHDGVDVPDSPPPPLRLGERPVIAAVGRLVAWKGQHVLLRAAVRVRERHPGARFVIMGGTPDSESQAYEQELRRLAVELGLEDSVTFTGFVKDVERFLRDRFDVVVHTSVQPEPFGLVLIETMAAGKLIVASNDGGCREIVEDGESGLLFEPGDSNALADVLLKALADPERSRRVARRGYERALALFDARRTAREVQAVYAEVLAELEAAKSSSSCEAGD